MHLVGIDMAPAASSAPGTARYVSQQIEALLSMSVTWEWLPTFESTQNPLYSKFGGARSIIVKGRSLAIRSTFKLGPAWRKHRCDLGFCPAYFTPLVGPPVVTNIFDSNIYEHFNTWVKSGKIVNAMLIRCLSNLAVRRSSKIFTLSNYCRDYLARRFPEAENKFVVTPPGIVKPSRCLDGGVRPGWMNSNQEGFLLYVGTFSENKNQRRLIEAFGHLQNKLNRAFGLVMAGPCEEDFRMKHLQPEIAKLSKPGLLYLPGRISQAELDWLYQNASAYIQPSIAEGFGLPVIEAMSYGLPVACSNTTSLPETAGDAALLFDPFEPALIAEAMCRLVNEPNLRMELIAKGEKRWREFTWEKNARLIVNQISQLL